MSFHYQNAKFICSAGKSQEFPVDDDAIEVAFAGRSNAGKSSVINTLTQRKNLAKTSKTPGRTQTINFFDLDGQRRLVDLPGYGFAKVNKDVQKRWGQFITNYFKKRTALAGVVIIMDIRHPLKSLDMDMINLAYEMHLPVHIVLTKADKLSRSQALKSMQFVKSELNFESGMVSIQIFSTPKRMGVDVLKTQLDRWFIDSA